MKFKPRSFPFSQKERIIFMAEERRLQKVTTGKAYIKKDSATKTFFRSLIVTDAADLWSYLKESIIKPFIRKGIVDFVTNAANMAVYGTPQQRNNGYSSPYLGNTVYTSGSMVPYHTYSNSIPNPSAPPYQPPQPKNVGFKFDLISWDLREDAMNVLVGLKNEMAINGVVSVAGYYELWNDNVTVPFTYNSWGWSGHDFDNLPNEPVATGDGKWYIPLPAAKPISSMQ